MGLSKSNSSYKKMDMAQAKLACRKDHPTIAAIVPSCCKAWIVPCTCWLMLCVTALWFLQATNISSCITRSQGLSSASYPTLLKMIQDNVLLKHSDRDSQKHVANDICQGKYVYMYDVPPQFNADLAEECTKAGRGPCAEPWGCLYCGGLENEGVGLQVPNLTKSGNYTIIRQDGFNYNYSIRLKPAKAWFRTHQYSSEVIFHARMKKYACLTRDLDNADAFYVPFYAGQVAAVSMKCNVMQLRDRHVNRFLGWLTSQDVWSRTRGQNHFMVLGRQPLDMNRSITANMWGLPITSQPELANFTFLWWEKAFSESIHEIGIPYPTSFHPSSDADLKIWQDTIKGANREWLVSYLGSARRRFRHESTLHFRQVLKQQCEQEPQKCRFMDCTLQYRSWQIPCESEPEIVTLEFSNAVFCLQPEGDTPTRKSIFDSMLAGCIPAVFSNLTAHLQYDSYLPNDPSLYSIFLNKDEISRGKTNFVQELAKIPKDRIECMQTTIREQILPRIVFSLPASSVSFQDAFKVALERVLSNFSSIHM